MKIERVNAEILKTLSLLIQNEAKDPRVSQAMVSVLRVDTTQDLKYAKVYVSIMYAEDKRAVLKVLQESAGYYKTELFHRLRVRAVPNLTFVLDESAEYSMKLEKILRTINITPAEEESDS